MTRSKLEAMHYRISSSVVLVANVIGLGEVPLLETSILALTVLRHFAKPVLWDSFKNLLGCGI